MSNNNCSHIPVLCDEVLEGVLSSNCKICIDCTFGAGGHSQAILKRATDSVIYAFDRDITSEVFFNEIKEEYTENRIKFFHTRFSNVAKILKEYYGIEKVDSVLFDLGVSSMQLDSAERGFSFLHDALLDMRMNYNDKVTASDFVNELSETEMADYIFYYGGERYSRKIAKAIVNYRVKKKISTTFELANIIRSVIKGYSKIDKATRTFQAIRIWVNDELNELKSALNNIIPLLNDNAVIAVISFHSGEDRVVKNIFRDIVRNTKGFKLLNKKVIVPTRQEVLKNNRSRSAKLRFLQKTGE